MTETRTAVIDRIEDGIAVLIFDGEDPPDGLDIDVAELPDEAAHEGAVLAVTMSEGSVESIEGRPDEENERRERAQNRFDRLSKRLGDE
ncbi:DUF3006 domain-containing protein [Halovenus halobia]|uniref:DUF3006 domain-containing protein n=1 Tax=Halovenus halobia TaxID=3396622 RepID=UPI003F5514C2